MNTWDEEFGARFHKLEKCDVMVWDEIFANEISHLKPGEVLAAVRTLGEQKRKGLLKYNPTVENLVSAIIKNRYLGHVQMTEGAPKGRCAFCGDTGWIPYCASRDGKKTCIGSEKYARENWSLYTMATPCLCSRGQQALNHYKPDDRGGIMQTSRLVVDWKKSITESSPPDDRRFAVDEG